MFKIETKSHCFDRFSQSVWVTGNSLFWNVHTKTHLCVNLVF